MILLHLSLEVWAPDTFFRGASASFVHEYEWSPLLSEFKRDFPDFDLRFKVMDRAAFVEAIHLTGPNAPPDIVFVDNQSERGPLMAGNGAIEMLGLSRFNQNGWWLIFRQSSVMDPQASRFYRLTASESVERVEPLLTFGNSRLAFVLTYAVCRQQKAFGMSHSASVLRKVDDQWKILLFLEGALPSLEGVLKSFVAYACKTEHRRPYRSSSFWSHPIMRAFPAFRQAN